MAKKSLQPKMPEGGKVIAALQAQPASARRLLKLLHLPAGARPALHRLLGRLLAEDKIRKVRGGQYAAATPRETLAGRLVQTQPGYAFVVLEQEGAQDLYVAAADLGGALPDDAVSVQVVGGPQAGRQRARVVRVLRRGHERLVGAFRRERHYGLFKPAGWPFVNDFLVPAEEQLAARDGDLVAAEVTAWPQGYVPGKVRVLEILGAPDQPGVDVTVIVRKYELPDRFSSEAEAEARQFAREPGPADREGRLDLRGQPIVTIDGADARDFDDAVHCELRETGGWRLGVHIADVSHYLPESSRLDLEARERGTSVYLPDRVLHMLPEPLSCGVCSLVPGRDRLTVSAFLDVEPDGSVSRTEFGRSVIHSAARLTYDEVQAVLTGTPGQNAAAAFSLELGHLHGAAMALRRRRFQRGSLDFDLPEAKVILGPEGRVTTIERRQQLASHRLIEDCMVAANEAVARYLTRTDTPALYRVHAPPDGEKLRDLQEFLEAYGYRLASFSPQDASRAYQKLLLSWQGKPEEAVLNFALLRSLKLAVYAPRNIGHFGLASRCYTHFTSPIRRYPDLIVHRMLTRRLAGPIGDRQLAALKERLPVWGEELSRAERRAEKAEREAVKVKQAEFMSGKIGETFAGRITTVAPFGFFVELEEHFVEGLVRVNTLEDDYYVFDERKRFLRGDRTGREFHTGDRVTAEVKRVDPAEGEVDFSLHEERRRPRADWRRHAPRVRPRGARGRKRR